MVVTKVVTKAGSNEGYEHYVFFCPGCGLDHIYRTVGGPYVWSFNGDLVKPTFTPSLLNTWNTSPAKKKICHLFVTNGQIQYCADSTHKLAGKTVEMAERFG